MDPVVHTSPSCITHYGSHVAFKHEQYHPLWHPVVHISTISITHCGVLRCTSAPAVSPTILPCGVHQYT